MEVIFDGVTPYPEITAKRGLHSENSKPAYWTQNGPISERNLIR